MIVLSISGLAVSSQTAAGSPFTSAVEANGRIAFVSDRDGNPEIYVMNKDGTDQTRLTNNTSGNNDLDYSPRWSPDGTKIVFYSTRGGNFEIYTMNANGTNLQRLTDNNSTDFEPVWSPDGQKIAFLSIRTDNSSLVSPPVAAFMINADGSNETKMLTLANNTGGLSNVEWSPDGSKLAFITSKLVQDIASSTISIANIDGSNSKAIITEPFIGGFRWSPDGKQLAVSMSKQTDLSDSDIYVVNADGGGISKQLTGQQSGDPADTDERDPSWSPDGSKIVFAQETGLLTSNIYSINAADGNGKVRLTSNNFDDRLPDWGARIVSSNDNDNYNRLTFTSQNGTNRIASLVHADGSHLTDLSIKARNGFENIADWSPDGSKILLANLENGGELAYYVADENGNNRIRVLSSDMGGYYHNWHPDGKKLSFLGQKDGKEYFYTVNADGSDLVISPTNFPLSLFSGFSPGIPRWSPDGSMIAGQGNLSGEEDQEIYTANVNGTGLTNVSNSSTSPDAGPVWSPDGKRVAFTSTREGSGLVGNDEVFVVNADGTGLTNVSNRQDSQETLPRWSPDGTKLTFVSVPFFYPRISAGNSYVVNSDGTGLTQISNSTSLGGAAWSPDGKKLMLHDANSIFTINPDGTGLRVLVDTQTSKTSPSWSPDGSKIAFGEYPPDSDIQDFSYKNLFVVNSDGTGLTEIADKKIFPGDHRWSPDSTAIAFTTVGNFSDQNSYEIYVAKAEGTGLTNVSKNSIPDSNPIWRPKPSHSNEQGINIHVETVDTEGRSVSGVWTILKIDGTVAESGFTPLNFTVPASSSKVSNSAITPQQRIIAITVSNYDGKEFRHWEDGNTKNTRILNEDAFPLSSETGTATTTLTATYDTGDSRRGFTPLTFSGTSEQPNLTILAKSLDGSNSTLSMYAIIDPQSVEMSSTTYTVYAGDYGDIIFDHWSDGSTDRIRTITIDKPTAITAYYRTGQHLFLLDVGL